jgi:hypothetical protein
MTRICWWLVDRLSQALEPNERDAVLGDLAESTETGGQALCDVLGLVVRRQAALWTHWRPWLTLVGLVVPLGMLLSIASRTTADHSAIYIWFYSHWWKWAFLRNPGFRTDLAHYFAVISVEYITLACWSWTSGFVLGSVSRRIIQVNGALFCLMLLLGAALGAPSYFSYFQQYAHARLHVPPVLDANATVFAGNFYRVIFPLILQTVLVAIPSLWGMREGQRVAGRQSLLRTTLWTAAIASLAALVLQEPGFLLFVQGLKPPGPGLLALTWLLQLFVCWPVVYLVASGICRRWRSTMASI